MSDKDYLQFDGNINPETQKVSDKLREQMKARGLCPDCKSDLHRKLFFITDKCTNPACKNYHGN